MTLPNERTNAVRRARRFLYRLTFPKLTPGVPKAIRGMAGSILRHYPGDLDLEMAAQGAPKHWAKPPLRSVSDLDAVIEEFKALKRRPAPAKRRRK